MVFRAMMRYTLFIFLFLSAYCMSAQTEKTIVGKRFSPIGLLEMIRENRELVSLTFRNCVLVATAEDEDLSLVLSPEPNWARADYPFDPTSKIATDNLSIRFVNCQFNPDENRSFRFENIFFSKLEFDHCSGYGIEFDDCVLYLQTSFLDCSFRYLRFTDSRVFEHVEFNDCDVNQFEITGSVFLRNTLSTSFGLTFENQNEFNYFRILNSEFVDASDESKRFKNFDQVLHGTGIQNFESFTSQEFSAVENYFDCTVLFNGFVVENKFKFYGNRLLREAVFEEVPSLPTDASDIPYTQFLRNDARDIDARGDGAAVLQNNIGIVIPKSNFEYQFVRYNREEDYRKDLSKPWAVLAPEKKIIPVYSRLLTIYDANNDLQSYNQCFRDLKEIEKIGSKVRWESRRQYEDWFRWKMDQFLQTYSAYGTDPVLSLINGFWTIMLFAALYVLFPSEEDNLSRSRITSAFERYILHFGKREKAFARPDEVYEAELEKISVLREQFKPHQQSMPPVIRAFATPIYWFNRTIIFLEHKARSLFYFDLFPDWPALSRRRRIMTTVWLTLTLILFIAWGIIMRAVNAFALSMNAFVTLGYGELEAKGIARYFCVLEGIVGWFVLSIFSVSLISQILQ